MRSILSDPMALDLVLGLLLGGAGQGVEAVGLAIDLGLAILPLFQPTGHAGGY